MEIDTDLDGGAILVHDLGAKEGTELLLRPDEQASFMQWFHFRASVKRGKRARYRIVNAGEATYADAWDGYRAAASYDGESWFRVPTEYDGEVLSFSHVPESDQIQYAYFAPFTWERHQRLLARVEDSRFARLEQIGASVDGRPMSLVVWGEEGDDKRKIWVTARQHPGETAAEWFMQGMIERLLDESDPLTQSLLEKAVIYLVPNMNPDGGVRGHHRTNAAGKDLNRQWTEPTEEESPEVLCVRERIAETGVDLFLDVHADERNPYIFAAGNEGNPSYSDRIEALEELFAGSLTELDGDFQREYGYERDLPGEADLSTGANYVGEAHDCLALTLEMPFKDNANHPDPKRGWSPDRAKHFGRTTLESAFVCLDTLR